MISKKVDGNIVDISGRRIFKGSMSISDGLVYKIDCKTPLFSETEYSPKNGFFDENSDPTVLSGPFIMPGFIDAHIHIESTMLTPVEYSRAVVGHGVTGSFSDPHEIANVCGLEGIRFMIENASLTPFPIWFGASPCVPSAPFEKYGSFIGPEDIEMMLSNISDGGFGFRYLSEMMNYPGVLKKDPVVMKKIRAAHMRGKPIDGHAPGLSGSDLVRYISAGISTDHECSTLDEAIEKAKCGMSVMIREGSAAKDFNALEKMIDLYPKKCMFCTDDCHPSDLSKGTIQDLVRRAVFRGHNLFDVLEIACINPSVHFSIPGTEHGLLNVGDSADFIVVSDLKTFNILKTYISGQCVFDGSRQKTEQKAVLISSVPTSPINVFNTCPRKISDLKVPTNCPNGKTFVKIIETVPDQIFTKK